MTDQNLTAVDVEAIRTRVRDLLPALRTDLEDLARIPSVSLDTLEGSTRHTSTPAPRRSPPCCGPKGSTSRSFAKVGNRLSSVTSMGHRERRR